MDLMSSNRARNRPKGPLNVIITSRNQLFCRRHSYTATLGAEARAIQPRLFPRTHTLLASQHNNFWVQKVLRSPSTTFIFCAIPHQFIQLARQPDSAHHHPPPARSGTKPVQCSSTWELAQEAGLDHLKNFHFVTSQLLAVKLRRAAAALPLPPPPSRRRRHESGREPQKPQQLSCESSSGGSSSTSAIFTTLMGVDFAASGRIS